MDIAKLSSGKAIPIHFLINRAWEPVALYPCQYWLYSFLKITVKPVSQKVFIYLVLITRDAEQLFLFTGFLHYFYELSLFFAHFSTGF